jgi:hypothetical protein
LRPDKRKKLSVAAGITRAQTKKRAIPIPTKRHKVVIKIKIISKYILDVIPARFKYRKPGIAKKII